MSIQADSLTSPTLYPLATLGRGEQHAIMLLVLSPQKVPVVNYNSHSDVNKNVTSQHLRARLVVV